jgi:chaperonin GroES
MSKNSELIIKDNRALWRGEGSTGLAIKDAEKRAEAVLDIQSHALKDDAVFVPMGDRITVKRIAEVELSAHGIVVPQNAKNPPSFGVVVGVGQGRFNIAGQLIPCRVQLGAVVAFGKFAGSDLPLFGVASKSAEPLLVLREEEVFGVIMSATDYQKVAADADPEIVGVAK